MSGIWSLRPFEPPSDRSSIDPALHVTLASGDALQLEYRAIDFVDLVVPPRTESPGRRDGLWRHTCAELFVADPQGEGYLEFNFCPSGHWAAYAFDGPRRGQRPHRWRGAEDVAAPRVVTAYAAHPGERLPLGVEFRIVLPWSALVRSDAEQGVAVRRVGLSFVAETRAGLGYWALQHAAAQPDFHHPDGFIATLETPA